MTSSDIDLSDSFRQRPGVLARELDGEVVLLDLESGRYFGLNASGGRTWELLAGDVSLAELVARLGEEVSAPAGAVEADLRELLAELLSQGLIVRAG